MAVVHPERDASAEEGNETGEPVAASDEATLRARIKGNSAAIADMVALAEILVGRDAKDRREAETLLARAAELAPSNRRAVDGIRRLLTGSGRAADWLRLRARLVRDAKCPDDLVREHIRDLLGSRMAREARDLLAQRQAAAALSPEAAIQLADAHEALGDRAEAARVLDRVATRLGKGAAADAIRVRGARLLIDAGQTGEAIRVLAFVDTKAMRPRALAMRGDAYRKMGEWAAAAREYRAALKLDPANGAWHAALGEALGKAGDVDGMAAAFRAAEAHGYSSTGMVLAVGDAEIKRGNVDRALEVLKEAAEREPRSAAAAAFYAFALDRAGRAKEAEAVYRRALANNPTAPEAVDARVNLAVLLARAGRWEDQRAVIEEGLRHGDDTRLRTLLGTSHLAQGNAERAREVLAAAAARDKEDARPVVELARLEDAAGRRAEAKAHWTEAVRRNPHSAEAQFGLAQIHEREGHRPHAIAALRAAIAANPAHRAARERLATLLEESGLGNEADSVRHNAPR